MKKICKNCGYQICDMKECRGVNLHHALLNSQCKNIEIKLAKNTKKAKRKVNKKWNDYDWQRGD